MNSLEQREKKLFVEWVDLGAQWDNLPGEDDLPGYDLDHSKRLSREYAAKLAKPIADMREAFTVRCLDCHDMSRMKACRTMDLPKARGMVNRMIAKRKGWVHASEIPLIMKYLEQNCLPKK